MDALNWNTLVISHFGDVSKYRLELSNNDGVTSILVRSVRSENMLYVRFDIDSNDLNRIAKVEFGSADTYILCRGIFNSSKEFNLEFVQNSWLDNDGRQYELFFSKENCLRLFDFLELPIKKGWKETHFIFKNNLYKVNLSFEVGVKKKQYEINLQSFDEQDIPLPFDSFFKRLRKIFIEQIPANRNKIVLKDYVVTPIL